MAFVGGAACWRSSAARIAACRRLYARRVTHPLLRPDTVRRIEVAVSTHAAGSWRLSSWTDLAERSSHPAMILRDGSRAVFAKLAGRAEAGAQVDGELAGLRRIGSSGVLVPVPIGSGRVDLPDGSAVLLFEALDERTDRTLHDWRAIGATLALIHRTSAESYGAAADGFFGPLPVDNRPVESDTWAEFYAVRRVAPMLRAARDAGAVDATTASRTDVLVQKLPELAGPEPGPRLLHGDAQHHNFCSTDAGAVVIDPSPYFGHPEVDLALLDYFSPVPPETWSAYAEVRPIDPGFDQRRELWRVFAYLAVITVDPGTEFGRAFHLRLRAALDRYV